MSRHIPADGERLGELAQEAVIRLGGVLREWVPPEAQIHLLRAQQELLTALVLIYEHQAGARRPRPSSRRVEEPARERTLGARARPRAAAPPRLRRIDID